MIICGTTSKGGSGKTTALTNLAVYWAQEGKSVFILDLDPQHSTATWGMVRDERDDDLIEVGTYGFEEEDDLVALIEHLDSQHDILLIDVPGIDDSRLRTALMVSDLAVVPVEVGGFNVFSAFDNIDVMIDAIKLRQERPLTCAIMLNRTGDLCLLTRQHRRQIQEYLDEVNTEQNVEIQMLEQSLGDLKNFRWAASQGLSTIEYDASNKSAWHVTALGKEINTLLQRR